MTTLCSAYDRISSVIICKNIFYKAKSVVNKAKLLKARFMAIKVKSTISTFADCVNNVPRTPKTIVNENRETFNAKVNYIYKMISKVQIKVNNSLLKALSSNMHRSQKLLVFQYNDKKQFFNLLYENQMIKVKLGIFTAR